MKSSHLTTLVWIAVVAFLIALGCSFAASFVPESAALPGAEPLTLRESLHGLSNLALLTGIIASLCAITLAGVRRAIRAAVLDITEHQASPEQRSDVA